MGFSVITDPVICVSMLDGVEMEMGFREIFSRAQEIKDICGESPLERYAVLRVLIAFAMDMLHPENHTERKKILRAGKFDENIFDNYVSECEKDGARFDLFDKAYPFMQAGYDEKLDKNAEKTAAYLLHYTPTGNNHIFWDHRREDDDSHQLSPGQAFRALCATYVFAAAGVQRYPSSVNNTPPVYVVALGKNLFETIVVNMLSVRECGKGRIDYGCGDVPWRNEKIVIPKQEFVEVTELGALTWMPRRVTLIQDTDGMVRKIYFQQGWNFKGNSLWRDPHVPYRKKKDGSRVSVKPETGREFWRDIGTLIYDVEEVFIEQPQVLKSIRDVYQFHGEYINLRMAGLVTDRAQYVEWQEEQLAVPACLMQNKEVSELFRQEIAILETLQKALSSSIILRGLGKEGKNRWTSVAQQANTIFLGIMHDKMFGEIMQEILEINRDGWEEEKVKQQINSFFNKSWKVIEQTLEMTVDQAGNSLQAMSEQIEIRRNIFMKYNKIRKEESIYE